MTQRAIQVYVDKEANQLIRAGAKEASLPLAAFCRSAAIREAKKILKENEVSN